MNLRKITSNNLNELFEKYFKIKNYKDTIDENADRMVIHYL